MIRTMAIYLGIVATVLASSLGLVFLPEMQMLQLRPYVDEAGNRHPVEPWGRAKLGREVYQDLGCVYCHSQQVRPEGFGSDLERGWGMRRSVARDYIYDDPHFLGTMRTGPDLMNIGMRQPDANWHYQHLYRPQITSEGSIMPPFGFLFEREGPAADGGPPRPRVRMPEGLLDENEYIVPTARGRNLVAYLKSLKTDDSLPEAR